MTVNDLIKKLQAIKAEGGGRLEVFCWQDDGNFEAPVYGAGLDEMTIEDGTEVKIVTIFAEG
jgi:hypothetical protein